MSDEDSDIDEEWINEFNNNEKAYCDFYKEKVEHIKIFYLYVNSSNILESIKREGIELDCNGILKKDKIITLINKNKIYNNTHYKLLSLLRFNMDINPEEINDFVYRENENENENELSSSFITSEKYLNDIKYSDTITIFQDLSSLYFIFYESPSKAGLSKAARATAAGAAARATAAAEAATPSKNNTRKIISINLKKSKNLKKTRRI